MDIGLVQGVWTVVVMVTFLAIVVWAFSGKRKKTFEEAANIPLEEEQVKDHE